MKKTVLYLSVLFATPFLVNAQQVQWVKQGRAPKTEYGNGITRDNAGHIYMTGSFQDSISFGATKLVDSYGTYCAKFDTTGTLIWAKKGMGGDGITFDGSSALYLYSEESLNLQKIDLDGNLTWDKKLFNTSDFGSNGIMGVYADANNFYATGFFSFNAWFPSDTLINAGNWDVFVAKYDKNGVFSWATGGGGTGLDKGYDVTVTPTGEVYATGYFKDAAGFRDGISLTSNGAQDIYIMKIAAAGNISLIRKYGGTGFDLGGGLDLDETGNLYLTGRYTDLMTIGSENFVGSGMDAFVAKFDGNLTPIWAKNIVGGGSDEEGDIDYDNGHLSFIATTGGNVKIGALNLTSLGNSDMCIGSFSANGTLDWAKLYGGIGQDEGSGILLYKGSNYFAGNFKETATFGSTVLTAVGAWDAVIGKIKPGSGSVGLNENTTSKPLIYPNPTQTDLHVISSNETTLEILDLTGKTLFNSKAALSHIIDVRDLHSGTYILRTSAENGVVENGVFVKE